ncbi:phosphatase PAP2 family protein [Thermomicrobium sp. 4228-Ro]|uniref:phosphatase PAP2 family protein n=1 Tax=Thermomicrobium sp. 4228-Ro TaxID=2993937 RepID=UPI0022495B52|nr:phosphatase PAP2 family protein [Thermomicrobium sp. 4228-Ro]MCX2727209.1 phosphatase PAP2 family protein [Thermomicrobium sp. 4228-Ro]
MRRRHSLPGLVAVLGALAAYAGLAIWVRRHPESPCELVVTRRLQESTPPAVGRFLEWISWLGFPPQSVLVPSAIIAGFWLRGDRRTATQLFFAWTASTVSFVTKRLVRRPRPNHPDVRVPIAQPRDASYPSGHVVTYTAFWLAALVALAERARWLWLRVVLVASAVVLVGTVGLSRIYLGHHWLTDVLGGYLLGGSWYGLVRFLGGGDGQKE